MQLAEIIQQRCGGFENLSESAVFAETEGGLRAALYHLRQLSGAWRDVLPRSVALRSLATLLDLVVAMSLDAIAALPLADIAAKEAAASAGAILDGTASRRGGHKAGEPPKQSQREQLHFLLGLLGSQAPGTVFHDELLGGGGGGGGGGGMTAAAAAQQHVASWHRLLMTTEVMGARDPADLSRRYRRDAGAVAAAASAASRGALGNVPIRNPSDARILADTVQNVFPDTPSRTAFLRDLI